MKQYAVIVAGGSGSRMGGAIPKQFRILKDRPVLWWSMKAFHDENPDTHIILVLPSDFIDLWRELFESLSPEDRIEHAVTSGGATRTDSVKAGLTMIDDDNSLVAVHDGARPLIDKDTIRRGWEKARAAGAAVPVVGVTDSLRKREGEGETRSVDRSEYMAVQTPQVFDAGKLRRAYEAAGDAIFTDDAAVMEGAGFKVEVFDGNVDNMKVTNPRDLEIAAVIMDNNV